MVALLDNNRTYDRQPGSLTNDDPGGSHEDHELSYASDALVHYAHYHTEIKDFGRRYGGLWLLSERQGEEEVAEMPTLM
jgi:hypothetical protein